MENCLKAFFWKWKTLGLVSDHYNDMTPCSNRVKIWLVAIGQIKTYIFSLIWMVILGKCDSSVLKHDEWKAHCLLDLLLYCSIQMFAKPLYASEILSLNLIVVTNLNFLDNVFTGKKALTSSSHRKIDDDDDEHDDDDNLDEFLEGMFPWSWLIGCHTLKVLPCIKAEQTEKR